MRVKVRAVILIDGRLVVARQSRRGRRELSLPGGRVNDNESVNEALRREVAEETGLQVVVGPLLYVFEMVESVRLHDLELIFLAHTAGIPALGSVEAIDLDGVVRPRVRPPILEQIALDAASEWRGTPRWLGNQAPSARWRRTARGG